MGRVRGGQLVSLAGMLFKIMPGGDKVPDLAMEGWHLGMCISGGEVSMFGAGRGKAPDKAMKGWHVGHVW